MDRRKTIKWISIYLVTLILLTIMNSCNSEFTDEINGSQDFGENNLK